MCSQISGCISLFSATASATIPFGLVSGSYWLAKAWNAGSIDLLGLRLSLARVEMKAIAANRALHRRNELEHDQYEYWLRGSLYTVLLAEDHRRH